MNLTLTQRIEIYFALKNELSIKISPHVILRNKSFNEVIINLFSEGCITTDFFIHHCKKYNSYLIEAFTQLHVTNRATSLIIDLGRKKQFEIVYSILKTKPIFLSVIYPNSLLKEQATIAQMNDVELFSDNREIIKMATSFIPLLLEYASARLQDDREIILMCVNKWSGSLRYTSERLRDDREIVLTAVKQNGFTLMHASKRLRNCKEIVLTAVENEIEAWECASPQIQALCQGQDPIEALTQSIKAEKLHNELGEEIQPKEQSIEPIKKKVKKI